MGRVAAGLTGQDISALGQVGQTQGQLAQSQMSPFTQALAAQTQMAQLVPKLGAQQFGVLQAFGDQNQKYAQAGIDALAQKKINLSNMLLTNNLVLLVNKYQD